ncbi:MAG: glycosyltransferase family 2 protein [Chitinophagaceae bacterium]
MPAKITTISPPARKEIQVLRLMIFIGILSVIFFLYSLLQKSNISYLPLYLLLMITMLYYVCKYLHEWYHYLSMSAGTKNAPSRIYTVDVLTTYCTGEPFDMLEKTLTAIRDITYPHTSWCCDEANDPMVRELCVRLGVKHVTRIQKNDAKAGNINHALQYASGEICVVLDPDHIPVPAFLDEILACFDDPTVGFVQIVQAYYNQAESLVAKGAAQQTYQFYGPVMMTMNSYGTVQAIGANCTFRRAALDSIGGHASGLAEDMHTAMQLHAKGWRSVYVPSILTRGLVPATMSSYYKQQLKWSRGTWELLVTTYPKLFHTFTWRQKFHYFTLPFHYLSGFIFLINFLIPVISLFTGYLPLQMDILNFLLAAFPLFCMGILIRQYVQKWVAEEEEQGFHIVGGILQIGTWWIYSVGFIYTLLRKKVPYIPTPKNDKDALPLRLSIPNLLVALISLMAIIYGFWHDYTPYTFFMAVLAFMQICFMLFIFSISGYIKDNSKLNSFASRIRNRNGFIILTHGFLRKYSLFLSLFMLIIFEVAYLQNQVLPAYLPEPLPGLQVFYQGIKLPGTAATSNITPASLQVIKSNQIAIVAIAIPWGEGEKNTLDTAGIEKLYSDNIVPLLNWKLWQTGSVGNSFKDDGVLLHIVAGKYDSIINSFAKQVARLERPVFLQCSSLPEGTKYPLFANTGAKPEDYIAAWQYVHHLFESAGADKVIWIWEPRDAAMATDFFPGHNYTDWLGVNVQLNHAHSSPNAINGFDTAYRPYHRIPLFASSGMPVIVTGIAGNAGHTSGWWKPVWKIIDTGFTEIKALITDQDLASLKNSREQPADKPGLPVMLTNTFFPDNDFSTKNDSRHAPAARAAQIHLADAVKAVVYNKGYGWFRNRHTLNIRTIEADVASMKQIGINTVERQMPGFYDDKLEKILLANNIKLIPRFWLLASPGILSVQQQMEQKKEEVLRVVKANLGRENIIAWHLGDDVLYMLGTQTYKPDLFYYRQKYIIWLANLCEQIRQLDTVRPIIMNLHWDAGAEDRVLYYKKYVPQINCYMREFDNKYPEGLRKPLQEQMAWGEVPAEAWPGLPGIRHAGTIPAWQDIENIHYVSMNGLLDMQGRKKQGYAIVQHIWGNKPATDAGIPDIKILRPAVVTNENSKLWYRILYKKDSTHWMQYPPDEKNVRFIWWLVRVDQYGNTMFIKNAGEGVFIELSIPMEARYYQLYVQAIRGDETKMVHTALNTPLE